MTDAEHSLHEAAANIPADVRERLYTAEKLSDEDRETILSIARKSLDSFQPKPEVKAEAKPDAKTDSNTEAQAEAKPKSETKAEP